MVSSRLESQRRRRIMPCRLLGRRSRGALGRRTLAAVVQPDAVVPELIAPVLALERPEVVLVVDDDARHVDVLARGQHLLLLLDLLFQLALLAAEDLDLDLDDPL